MDEREAARDKASPLVKLRGQVFEMAGTGLGYHGDDAPLVKVFEAASKGFFFVRKHPLTSSTP
jgi:hypothetical protein